MTIRAQTPLWAEVTVRATAGAAAIAAGAAGNIKPQIVAAIGVNFPQAPYDSIQTLR